MGTLGSFKEKLDQFAAENEKFRATNKDLKSSVNNLNEENRRLEGTNTRLEKSIAGLDEVRQAMETYAAKSNADMGQIMTSLHDSIAQQKQIQEETRKIQQNTKKL